MKILDISIAVLCGLAGGLLAPNLRVQDIKPGTSGQIAQSNATSMQYSTVSGDATIALGGAVTVAKANGNTFPASVSAGDLIYGSGASTLAKRSIGATGEVLTVSGGLPVWSTANTVPGGTSNQTLYYNSGWTASSVLRNDGTRLGINQAPTSGYSVGITPTSASDAGLRITGASGQSGSYFQLYDVDGLEVARWQSNGVLQMFKTAAVSLFGAGSQGLVNARRANGTAGSPAFPNQNQNVGQFAFGMGDRPLGTFTDLGSFVGQATDATPSATNAGGRIIGQVNSKLTATNDEVFRLTSEAAGDARVRINGTADAAYTLQVDGGLGGNVRSTSSSVTLNGTDWLVVLTGSGQTITLPPATNRGQEIMIVCKTLPASAHTVQRAGSDTIQGVGLSSPLSLAADNKSYTLIADGVSVWYVKCAT